MSIFTWKMLPFGIGVCACVCVCVRARACAVCEKEERVLWFEGEEERGKLNTSYLS